MKQNIKKGRYLFYEGEVYDLGGGGDSGEAMAKAEEAFAAAQTAQTTADGAATAAGNAQTAADNAQDTADAALAKGLPAGGSSGQVLSKASAADYDAEWVAPPSWDLLWTNASPTSAFAAQTIAFDYSGYDFLAVVVRNRTDQPVQTTIIIQAVNGGGYTASKNTIITNEVYWQYRQGTLNSTGLAVENAFEAHINTGGFRYDGVSNPTLIPVAIYGIKNL